MYDITIIGGGIEGLATGYQLLEYNPLLKLIILEKERKFGLHQLDHNSGMIHSEIYYKPGDQTPRLTMPCSVVPSVEW